MKISAITCAETNWESWGLRGFSAPSLGDVVVLAGRNGSGKTRLLRLLQQYVDGLRERRDNGELRLKICPVPDDGERREETLLTPDTVSQVELVDYSHYDAQLQLPAGYTPYVISKARQLLREYRYEETALNALLLLEDMAKGYSPEYRDGAEWRRFVENYAAPFQLELTRERETLRPLLFGRGLEEAALSPGQQYLLRIAVACCCNEKNEKVIFLLDEPELHLHPEAQIGLIRTLRDKFPRIQLWISTHSLALISFLTVFDKSTTVLYMDKGETKPMRSDSGALLSGLIGSEENRFAIRQLMAAPDEYACNRFAVECLTKPEVSDALEKNPQNELLRPFFQQDRVIVDFGVGKCRLLEELSSEISKEEMVKVQYYAYDRSEEYAAVAKHTMDTYGSACENYYNDKAALTARVGGQADCVFMVNVLHEIDPGDWEEEMAFVRGLLKEDGQLVIVEREELTVGEAPYPNGFLMMTQNGAAALFGEENCRYDRHWDPKKSHIVRHIIKREGLSLTPRRVEASVGRIRGDAQEDIRRIKRTEARTDEEKFKNGIRLAFCLNQFANASLIEAELREKSRLQPAAANDTTNGSGGTEHE